MFAPLHASAPLGGPPHDSLTRSAFARFRRTTPSAAATKQRAEAEAAEAATAAAGGANANSAAAAAAAAGSIVAPIAAQAAHPSSLSPEEEEQVLEAADAAAERAEDDARAGRLLSESHISLLLHHHLRTAEDVLSVHASRWKDSADFPRQLLQRLQSFILADAPPKQRTASDMWSEEQQRGGHVVSTGNDKSDTTQHTQQQHNSER